jgi:hypothetical protein
MTGECWMIRDGMALRPWGVESGDVISKLPNDKPLEVTIKTRRNARHSALYWVLCHRIANAIGANDPENVSDVLKIETGHCVTVRTKSHGEIKLPRSISFAKMGQQEFAEFFERCLVVIQSEWGIERPDMLAAVKDLLEEKAEA